MPDPTAPRTVDAVILAGGVPAPGEPLYAHTQGRPKALLEIGGRPIIQWVLDAAGGARGLRRVVIVGLDPGDAPLRCAKPLGYVPSQGGMLANIVAGVRAVLAEDAATPYALVISGDLPAITPAIVDWNVAACSQTDHEIYYSTISKDVMERRFPGARRSYYRFKDGIVAGGDMTMIATPLASHYHPMWRAILDARKNLFKQAQMIGFSTLFWLALGRLSLADAERRVSRRLGVKGRLLICPHAEAGMDVDKPAQYELLKRDLERG